MDPAPAFARPAAEAFDGFRLIEPLGRGGMGSVWLGHDAALDRPVALKFLSEERDGDDGRAGLLLEARALARIHHPNVVAVYRVGEVEGNPYIAYEYVDGRGLELIAKPMPWSRVLRLALGLARGLAAVHRHGVLHRDIKPANIVLTSSGEPKLIDFGIAKLRRQASAPAGPARDPRAVQTDVALAGTPLYMAPELWLGLPASEASDLYALGLVIFELLVGSLPHAHLAGDSLIAHLATREVPHVRTIDAAIPAAFADLIARLTAASPGARYQRADAVVDALDVIRSLYRSFVETRDDGEGDGESRALLAGHLATLTGREAALGRHFYDGLFAKHPELRPLFPAELAAQRAKLESALDLVVRNLGARETLVPLLEDLGARHVDYGVEPEHLALAGEQLLTSLAALSGERWTEPLRRAWAHAYDRVAHVMVRGLTRAQAKEELATTHDLVPPTLWNLPVGPPQTLYARSGALSIAYQVVGSSPLDVLLVPGFVSHLELTWDHPTFAGFIRRLASFSRVILFDKRGTGLSDGILDALSIDEQIADVDAILDAAGSDRAVVLSMSTGGALAAAYAALRPERVRALILDGAAARASATPDYPHGLAPERVEELLEGIRSRWGGPLFVEAAAPALADDPVFREWWARYLRAGASPGAAESVLRSLAKIDIRGLLPAIHAPTLLLHRRADRLAPIGGARAIAAMIRGARLVELEGDAHLPFIDETDALLAEIHGFIGDAPAAAPITSQLSTRVAVAAHDPATAPAVRALFARALGGLAPLSTDSESLTAELRSAVQGADFARAVVSAADLFGFPVSAAVVTARRGLGDADEPDAAQALARGTPAGRFAMGPLARELSRGSRAASAAELLDA